MTTKLENAPTIRTEVVSYRFDVSQPEQREQYEKLCEELRGTPGRGHWMNCLSEARDGERATSGTVELDCSHLFENQWNTTDDSPTNTGMRLFDWFERIYPNKKIKAGHYLVITDEIREIRRNVNKCGYCGAHHWAVHGLVFCHQCLGSEYLTEDRLHLLRLRPIDREREDRKPLAEGERAHLLPLYVAAQTEGANTRAGAALKKQREDLEKHRAKAVYVAETEFAGKTWLMDNGVNIGNCIYYSHTDRFCFGWREPVSDSVRDALLDMIIEFPYRYEIKCADGKTLENY